MKTHCALTALPLGFVRGGFVPATRRTPFVRCRGKHPLATPHEPWDARWGVLHSKRRREQHEHYALSAHTSDINNDGGENRWQHFFSMMRPVTIIQAVGAFVVGRLVILSQQQAAAQQNILPTLMASISIYLAYGAGMAMNDCADAGVDAQHVTKQNRSIASEVVSVRDGWIFCFVTSMVSIAFAYFASSMGSGGKILVGTFGFVEWTLLNLLLMAGYALGMQRWFLVKNLLCGFFAISPLVGASLLGDVPSLGNPTAMKLYQLAAIGFPLQISREVLKDCEDVEVDRNEKQTLPLVIGEKNSKRIAYGLVGLVNGAMIFSPYYWRMFASEPPVYAISVAVGTLMCAVASRLPLAKGQRLLKKSIYVLLAGMISGLLLQ